MKFRDLDCMPIQKDLASLDEGDELENTFVTYKARWHKGCCDLFNSTKLKKAEKRHPLESEQPVAWWNLHTFSFACISQQQGYMFFFVESILHVITLFTMFQQLV